MNQHDLHQAHIVWLATSNFDVFATLKFRNGYDISPWTAQRILSIYLNKLDREHFGKKEIRAGQRVLRHVYLHKGQSGKNTHFHIAFTSIGPVPRFCALAHWLWEDSFRETCGVTSQVTPVRSHLAASVYALHEFGKLGADTFLGELSHT